MPAIPRIPPLWRESRIGLEAAALRRSPVYGGLGVPPGERPPVLLIPGFMAGDLSLGTMSSWLRRAGYCTHRTGTTSHASTLHHTQHTIHKFTILPHTH